MDKSKINEKELARALVPLVGNKENITSATHCVTRLRFILEDETLADKDAIEQLPGVVKVISSGGQYQVVIGTSVAAVHEALKEILDEENTEQAASLPQEENTASNSLRKAFGNLTAFLTSCMQPLIPVLVSVGMIRTFAILLGPEMLGVLDGNSGTLRILTLVGEAGLAALPIFISWSASNYLKTNTILAIFYGAFLIYPGLTQLINSGETIRLFALPVPPAVYTSQVVPVMLIMYAMYLVEKALKRILPEAVRFIGMPILETVIMLPVMLCLVGPLGTIMGNYISEGAQALYRAAGPLSVALIGAFFIFICATGMHTAIIATALQLIQTQGYDSMALVGAGAAAYACFGVYLAYTMFVRDPKEKQIGFGALITHALGGIAEPGMFSLLFTHGQLMCIEMIASFFGALYLGVQRVGLYTPGISNFMAVLQFAGEDSGNMRNAVIGCAISFIIGFVLTAIMLIRKENSGLK